ncbi:carbohydrate ABC transporter permease [Paenibacillus lautus]|uniref:carbohydrate ABC transporter permease n=1 Tax=Paenibacillus lautus TaxID=1401 RepID=UPI003D2913BB
MSTEADISFRRRWKTLGWYVLAYGVTLLILLPVLWVCFLSFRNSSEILNNPFSWPASWNLENYKRAFATLDFFTLYKNTIFVAVITIVIEIVITFMSSFALTRMVFKSKRLQNLIQLYFISGLAIPAFILIFPVYRITITLDLLNSYGSLVLPYIATAIAFNTLLFTGFLRGFPKEVEEAAIIDGSGLYMLCKSIVFPIIMPVVSTVFIFNILYIWNEFPFAVTLISDAAKYTISLGISQFKGAYSIDYGGTLAAGILIIVPQLIFFGVFQRFIIEGMTAGAVKG